MLRKELKNTMENLSNFNWGWMEKPSNITVKKLGKDIPLGEYHKNSMKDEIFVRDIYQKHFSVEENDVVVDLGASVGPFTYKIISNKPSKVICIEPSSEEFPILKKNLQNFDNIIFEKCALSNSNSSFTSDQIFSSDSQVIETTGITFPSFVKKHNLDKIDFLKTDCEGGEYDIFMDIDWVKNNIKKICGEWHLSTPLLKAKFRVFRDTVLIHFNNYHIFSVDNIDIKWDLWNEHFIEYYNEVLIYIDNRK
tara:strand:+ start:2980 stop:3732 length:753 start_codon:yes stop_codon:yes gene_type:complete